MKYVRFGNTDMNVSRLCLGGMTFSRKIDPQGTRAVIDEALAAKETGEERVILFNYCGHGFLDLSAYDDFNNGRLPEELG